MNIKTNPIIIIGTHRSGTSMVSDLLSRMGLFTGWQLDSNNEAIFFRDRNEKLLNAQGGGWLNPKVIDNLINHADMRNKVVDVLYKDITTFACFSYLGPAYYLKYRSLPNFDMPWGWKDPRNTFLLPLWLDIFPNAKIVHIVRNGVDVAQSLAVRESKRITGTISKKDFFLRGLMGSIKNIRPKERLGWLIVFLKDRIPEIQLLGKYEQYGVHSVLSVEKGFHLWCDYVEREITLLRTIKNDVLSMRYEDILIEPDKYLDKLNGFIGLTPDSKTLKACEERIISGNRYRFQNDDKLTAFYSSVKTNQWMKHFRYEDI